jgi:hypothetical protein
MLNVIMLSASIMSVIFQNVLILSIMRLNAVKVIIAMPCIIIQGSVCQVSISLAPFSRKSWRQGKKLSHV